MLRFNAIAFLEIMTSLELIESLAGSRNPLDKLDAQFTEKLKLTLNDAFSACDFLDLDSGMAKVKRILAELEQNVCEFSDLEHTARDHRERIEDQFGSRLFMFIPNKNAAYYEQHALFGEGVPKKFPALDEDIEEAGNCLGLMYLTSVWRLR